MSVHPGRTDHDPFHGWYWQSRLGRLHFMFLVIGSLGFLAVLSLVTFGPRNVDVDRAEKIVDNARIIWRGGRQ